MARRRKSNEEHKLNGAYRSDRHDGGVSTVLPELFGIPNKPNFIEGEAEKERVRITRHLDKQGVLTELDRASLSHYCLMWNEMATSKEPLPMAFHGQFRLVCQDLGLTPSSRSKVMPNVKKEGKVKTSIFDGSM